MIRLIVLVALCVTPLLAWQAGASRAAVTPTVVGTIDLPRVLEALDEWKAEMARSQAAGEAFQVELEAKRTELDGLAADIEDFRVGTEQYAAAEHALKKASIDLRAFMSLADMREARTKQRAILRIYNHVRAATRELSEQEGYGIVLMDDSAIPIAEDSADVLGDISSRRVLYASTTLDITDPLIAYMNAQWQAARGR
jgi:Skp family chaperone for outer membrane proteins